MRRSILWGALCFVFPAASALSQDSAKQRLEGSPRHQEWVQVKHGDRTVHAFVVYPETKGPAPAIVVIHQNRGLTVTYEGAGHGFMRAAEETDASVENRKAHDEAWSRWKELLKKTFGPA